MPLTLASIPNQNTFGRSTNAVVAIIPMEIKDNAFSRQFETTTAQGLVTVEYLQKRKYSHQNTRSRWLRRRGIPY
jgi:hypothetical protein